MIEYNPKTWFKVITTFHKSGTVHKFWKEMILMGVMIAILTFFELKYFRYHPAISKVGDFHSFLGLAFSLLLVFRINSAYDKWWEGRKLWGKLVNDSRNLALKIGVFLKPEDKDDRQYISTLISNYAFSLKEHLRGEVKFDELDNKRSLLEFLKNKEHIPNGIALKIYEFAKNLKNEGRISEEEFLAIDKEIKGLTDVLGGCERIKKTPIPYSYSLFLKKFIFVFVSTAPIGFIPAMAYWTIPVGILIFYVFVSLEYIAEEIEDPFGLDENDLPTDQIAKTIKENVREILE
jgi:putative membrane protein